MATTDGVAAGSVENPHLYVGLHRALGDNIYECVSDAGRRQAVACLNRHEVP